MTHGIETPPVAAAWRRRLFRAAASCLLAWSLAATGCGGDGLTRGAVSGQVTLDGKPLPAGRILFTSQGPEGGPTVSTVIRDGVYQLSAAEGPVVGPQKVEVEIDRQLGFAIDDEQEFAKRNSGRPQAGAGPPAFRAPTNLTTVIAEGTNVYDVSLPPLAR
ncbi:MAG: hypothetical protein U0939_25785 [Pirellulales bacterium]